MFLLDEKTAIPKKNTQKTNNLGSLVSLQFRSEHVAPAGLSDPKLFSGAVQKLLLVVVLH